MKKNLRDERQKEFAKLYLDYINRDPTLLDKIIGFGAILDLCPRFGKCRTAIHIFNGMGSNAKILIAYPNLVVEQSWKEEFKKMKFNPKNITFTTHRSIKKYQNKEYDLLVLDECHLLSPNQLSDVWHLKGPKPAILGLSGTISEDTKKELDTRIGLFVLGKYSMTKAIEEGIITDYEITVLKVPLDTKHKVKYKSSVRTEKEQFDAYTAVINKLEMTGAETFYLRLARMRLIQGSRTKLEATNSLLDKFKGERVLAFCGLTKTADGLKCPSYHSKSKNSKELDKFSKGEGEHLAVVKIGNTGTTYKPLNKVLINYFDSNPENLCQKINRCMGLEYSNPEKKADIWIISSDEPTELKWLNKALKFFDPKKITYI